MLGRHRIKQLATQQIQRCHVVELNIVKGVGQDFCRPREPGFKVLDKKQLDCPLDHTSGADEQPH
jgi:hypothetical protein